MLIVVEGQDDKRFLDEYCEFLGLQGYEIVVTLGKDKICKQKPKISAAIGRDEQILVIFDTDKSYTKSLSNIHHQFKQLDIQKDSYCTFLFPKNEPIESKDINLDLEHLIRNIAKEQKVFECLEQYEHCLKAIGMLSNKAKIYAYREFYAFQAGINCQDYQWRDILDFEHQELENLKQFLLHYAQKD